jgi:hypothetical protein
MLAFMTSAGSESCGALSWAQTLKLNSRMPIRSSDLLFIGVSLYGAFLRGSG